MASENSSNSCAEHFLPFNAPVPWNKLKSVAKNELGETDEVREERLLQLRQLIRDRNLKCITRDDFLLRFLRTRKFEVQRSFKALENYSRQRASWHDRLMKLQPDRVRGIVLKNIIGFLPYRDKEGRLIFFFDSGIWNPDMFSVEDIFMTFILLVNYGAESPSSQTIGVQCLFEVSVVPWYQVPILLRLCPALKAFLFESIPGRYKFIHAIDEHPTIKYVIYLLKPFVPKKIMKRIHFHGQTRDKLFEFIPPSILPDVYGGNFGPLHNEQLADELVNYLKKMKEDQCYFI